MKLMMTKKIPKITGSPRCLERLPDRRSRNRDSKGDSSINLIMFTPYRLYIAGKAPAKAAQSAPRRLLYVLVHQRLPLRAKTRSHRHADTGFSVVPGVLRRQSSLR